MIPNKMYIAHSKQTKDSTEFQKLKDHLFNVSRMAGDFAASFGATEWGKLAGLWHDIGKYSKEFQDYLSATAGSESHSSDLKGRVDHSTAGAQLAAEKADAALHLIAYAVAGHHSGLLDSIGENACQLSRLKKTIPEYHAPLEISNPGIETVLPSCLREALSKTENTPKRLFSLSFFTRMLYSCLVDADFLDTESFIDPERAASRPHFPADILKSMSSELDAYIDSLGGGGGNVDAARNMVRESCNEAADSRPGLFSLTVPTGGGKTLSSLSFALRHAIRNGMRRIIYVIPFTSIIEQNAQVFRKAMRNLNLEGAPDPVLEHHCNAVHDPEQDNLARMAAENWDAPLVVTTNVQFYESLFANRSSKCRKLHNIAGSIVILDEVQSIPVDLMEPILESLKQLVKFYNVTVVLCTATQPALEQKKGFEIGMTEAREIIPESRKLYESLKRVEVTRDGKLEDKQLAEKILEHNRVLCIVNTRNHARLLYELIGSGNGHFHLSARMCPVHRSEILEKIKYRLKESSTCRVVSTQLIEAGVDIDFPIVFRSMAGLDSIAQAAGRCNREGRLPGMGEVRVFKSEHESSERFMAETANVAMQILPLHEDPLDIESVEHYFRQYYWEQNDRWDSRGIMGNFEQGKDLKLPFLFDFKKTAKAFRLMEQSGHTVIIPWTENGKEMCAKLRRGPPLPGHAVLRDLQRYSVSIPEREYLKRLGTDIELIHDRFAVLTCPEQHYSNETGLVFDQEYTRTFIV